jgi:hypothetical protein
MARNTNHQFLEIQDKVYSRYRKTSVGAVCGARLHPRTQDRVSFILMSSDNKFNPEGNKLEFDYDTDVVEIYSEGEDKTFRAWNSYLFKTGLLVPYTGEKEADDISAAMSDEEITSLVATKNLLQFKSKVSKISSKHTLQRILEENRRQDKKHSFIQTVEARINEL